MAMKDPRELFVMLLSDLRHGAERTTQIFQEVSKVTPDRDIREVLEARASVSGKILKTIDECFTLIGENPVKIRGCFHDTFAESFRKELAEIQAPETKCLLILARANHLIHLRIGEYEALIAAADMTGHYAVGVLLEDCLADKLSFVERTRRLIRERPGTLIEVRSASAAN